MYIPSNIKILFFIASYGENQLNYLYLQIKSFVIICESGYVIKIIIHHTNILKNSSFNNFYCFKQDRYINIVFIRISSLVKHFLVKEHRKYILDNINEIKNYDHIGFFENDIGFTLSNLKYYFFTMSLFKKYKMKNTMVGFKRFEIGKCTTGDIWRNCPDYINNVTFLIIKDMQFIRIKDGFCAMWILPLSMLLKYVHEYEFLIIPENAHNGITSLKPYYSYSYWERHFIPLIPLLRIDDCFVHHMSNKHIHYHASIQLTELYSQLGIYRTKTGLKYNGPVKNRVININRKNVSKKCVQLLYN